MKLKQFEDFQLYVRENDWGFWQNSEYEPEETKLIKSLVKQGDYCIDVGANIGYYTILIAKLGAFVCAYEPEKSNFDLLKKNIFLNHLPVGIDFNRYAVGNQRGWKNMYLCPTNNGMHRMYKSKFTDEVQEVPVTTLDYYHTDCGYNKLDFVKIDVEGTELDVLQGMIDLLQMYKPKMLIEFHPPTIEEKGNNPKEIYDFLTILGYDIRLVPNIDQTISYEDLYKETMKEPSGRNILCMKK